MTKEVKKEENDSNPHFAKIVNYAPNEPWRTDILVGQKGSEPHGHLSLSGASILYLRDEQGKEIIVNGDVMEESGFKEGDELKAETKKGEIRLRK